MSTLLERQIEKCLGSLDAVPPEFEPLFDAIRDAYEGFESDRQLTERSLDISSQELRAFNDKLRQEIADRKLAEQKQAKLLEEVMKVNNELVDFAYVISHDLKSPLRGISSLVTWICNDNHQVLSEETREQLDQVLQRIQRMYHLIEGLLEYSRLKPIPEIIVPVSLQSLVQKLIETMDIPDTMTVTIESELPVIKCEYDTVLQIFQHLLENAINYMDKPHGQISIYCREQPDNWEFRICDNGPGIDEKYFERIFRIFQILERWELSNATGIGLSLVKKAVEMHGGKIWVESEVGQGTTFTFTLSKQLEAAVSRSHTPTQLPIMQEAS